MSGWIGGFAIGLDAIGVPDAEIILSHYESLITPQHAGKSKFMATISATMGPIAEARAFLATIQPAFDIDFAIGAQLDIAGLWVGRSRQIPVPIASPWMSLDDAIRGLDHAPLYVPGITAGNTYASLDDDTYRRLLYAKRAANAWDGMATSAQAILTAFIIFPGALIFVEDKGDRTMAIGVAGQLPPIVDLEILGQNLIPLKPTGVELDVYVTSVNGAPLAGCDVENSLISGCDVGALGVTPDYAAQHV